jgi:predicted nucleotidyltransferase
LLDIIAIKQDLEDLLGSTVHVVTEDAISPYIREEVLKQAIAL